MIPYGISAKFQVIRIICPITKHCRIPRVMFFLSSRTLLGCGYTHLLPLLRSLYIPRVLNTNLTKETSHHATGVSHIQNQAAPTSNPTCIPYTSTTDPPHTGTCTTQNQKPAPNRFLPPKSEPQLPNIEKKLWNTRAPAALTNARAGARPPASGKCSNLASQNPK